MSSHSFLSDSGRFRLALLASSCAALAIACGGISDPTKEPSSSEKVATVSGALTGTSVPANARVALVWRTNSGTATDGGYAVGDDVPVVAGKFTMSLAVPADAYFSTVDGEGFSVQSGGGSVALPPGPSEDPAGTAGSGGAPVPLPVPAPLPAGRIAPRDNVSGGLITNPLAGAVAGFVVYADTNGNGKLDLAGPYAASTDQILGGNKELLLAYLKDGGQLDYEKMRDSSGILPAKGFNLAWIKGRWLPLDVVELKLDAAQGLPSPVCSSSGPSAGSSGAFNPVGTEVEPDPIVPPPPPPALDGGAANAYPAPTDPDLRCAPDGRSFVMQETPCTVAPSPPPPVGLCALGEYDTTSECSTRPSVTTAIADGQPVPEGWPCNVATAIDGGAAPDPGTP